MRNSDFDYIISDFRKGDQKAFAQIYDLYYGPIYCFARRILTSNAEAQDVTAETFMKLWRLHSNFETMQNIKAFLYIAVRNASFNILRQRKDNVRHHQDLNYFLAQDETGPTHQDEVKAEVLQVVLKELSNLPRQCRKVLEFSFLRGLKNNEIASEMGLSLQTVKNQKNRGIRILKVSLASREGLFIMALSLISSLGA
jgi:RNA polymerase sigma-70 factor (ECF subfamily)